MSNSVNVLTNDITVDIVENKPTVNVVTQALTLDIESGGIVAANIDTVLVAGASLSALRCITTNGSGEAIYATPDSLSNAVVIGISTTEQVQDRTSQLKQVDR